MVIPAWNSHMVTVVYFKLKLLAGEDGASCFQTELFAFHKNTVDFPGFECLPKPYWEVLISIAVY